MNRRDFIYKSVLGLGVTFVSGSLILTSKPSFAVSPIIQSRHGLLGLSLNDTIQNFFKEIKGVRQDHFLSNGFEESPDDQILTSYSINNEWVNVSFENGIITSESPLFVGSNESLDKGRSYLLHNQGSKMYVDGSILESNAMMKVDVNSFILSDHIKYYFLKV